MQRKRQSGRGIPCLLYTSQFFFRDVLERGLLQYGVFPAAAEDSGGEADAAISEAADDADFDEFFEADDPEADE